ncbi:hypothetical protein L596_013738 [Steinernema carpocapsae]|uniref:Helicase ATP-binding domain-containing protein n=1 Tax=Steinernema carpocapsae TaxID=34508 RepID=A0A4U5P177_STECR|nr:hypothetical protein L596_013738 [Steinernema carpocapsae]
MFRLSQRCASLLRSFGNRVSFANFCSTSSNPPPLKNEATAKPQDAPKPASYSRKLAIQECKKHPRPVFEFKRSMLPEMREALEANNRQPGEGPILLMLLSSPEATQLIGEVIQAFCDESNLSLASISDQASLEKDLQDGVDIVIGTPGFLLDSMKKNAVLRSCSYLVFDGVDKMIENAFEYEIREIAAKVSTSGRTLMFSEQWSQEARTLAADLQKAATAKIEAEVQNS